MLLALIFSAVLPAAHAAAIKKPVKKITKPIIRKTMQITSSAFVDKGLIPKKYTCDGAGINPPLQFSQIPKGAQSLVLIIHDPDVPKAIRADGNWDHWIVWNIPPTTTQVKEGGVPSGVVGKSTSGDDAYGGPCPPDKEHRYYFTLSALDTTVSLAPGSSKSEVTKKMRGHVLTTAQLMGRYARH